MRFLISIFAALFMVNAANATTVDYTWQSNAGVGSVALTFTVNENIVSTLANTSVLNPLVINYQTIINNNNSLSAIGIEEISFVISDGTNTINPTLSSLIDSVGFGFIPDAFEITLSGDVNNGEFLILSGLNLTNTDSQVIWTALLPGAATVDYSSDAFNSNPSGCAAPGVCSATNAFAGLDGGVAGQWLFMENPPAAPEPAGLALIGLGLFGIAATRKRKAA